MNFKKHSKFIITFVALFFFYALIQGSFSIYRELKGDTIDLNVLDPTTTFTVRFDENYQGGSITTRTKNYNQPVGDLTTPTRSEYNFIGWYTDPTDGSKINASTLVTGNVTYYAHWEKIICQKAVAGTLHTETCDSSGSCHVKGFYNANDTITYGTVPGTYSPIVGDAYDCDVNDDGVFDPLTERFYYIREVTDSSGTDPVYNSFLVHFTSFDENGQMDSSSSRGSYVYNTAINYLPTSTLWDNSGLISMNGNVTRFIDREDIKEACGSYTAGNYFETCQFFLEHSRFQNNNLGRAGIWIEKENDTLYRIHTQSLTALQVPDAESNNTVRPVIQIPSYAIEGYKVKGLYRIDFDSQGGSSVSYIERIEGETLGTLETPTKTGFVFDGWYTDNEDYTTQVTENTVVTGSATYYAKWLEELMVNFNANGIGASVSPTFKKVGKGKAIGEMPTPTYTGHEFSGWYTDPTAGTEVTASTIINSGTTLYAHWAGDDELPYVFYIPGECSFTSSGLANGTNGNCVSTINPTGSDIDYTQNPLRTKKYIDTGIALYGNDNHDKDYEIGFTIVSYTTTGQADKATLMNTKAEVSTASLKYPGVVFRRNNSTDDFLLQSRETLSTNAEYIVDSSTVENVKIYRIGNEIYYSINGAPKVLLNNLDSFNPVFDLTTWFGAAPKDANASTAQRYFIGTLSNMYIKLEEKFVKVTLDPNYEGAQTTTQNVVRGGAVGELDAPAPRVGYTFLGWYTEPVGGTEVTESTVVNADVIYYAHWAENITVTFNANGGTVSPNSKTFAVGTAIGELPTPEYSGYAFLGWYTDNTWTDEVTESTVFNSTTSIVAKWVESVTVTFNANGGTVSPNSKTFAFGAAIGELPTPEYSGHTFLGWYTDSTWTDEVTESTVFNSTTSIVAKWVENVVVTLHPGDGTVTPTTLEFVPGSAVGTLPTPTYTGYEFDGWYEESTFDTLVTEQTIVTSSTTDFYAKWVYVDYEAEINGQKYRTLAEAITAVPTTGVKTTVTILKDITTTETTTIPNKKWVELDIGTYTIQTNTGVFSLITNKGKLDIINGTLYSSAGYIVENFYNSTLNISGGTLTYDKSDETEHKVIEIKGGIVNITGGSLSCNSKAATINVNAGTLNVSGGEIKGYNTFKGQAIYNNGGTTNISGTASLENNSQIGTNGRACVHNSSGTVNITGGTIVSKNNAAVKNNGTMTIGTDEDPISITSPVMQGNTYGLETVSGYSVAIYDGIFKGGAGSNPAKAISDETYTSHGTTVITHDTEVIEGVTYDVAYLVEPSASYTVTFNAATNGGLIDVGGNNTQTYTEVGPIGSMPTASKTDASFLGWFTAATGGDKVLTTTVVDNDVTYYAHYTSQTTVCRPATILHSSGGTDFGQIPSGDTFSSGDAFDCDVNGDGTYDATNERFYYLTDSSDGNAVLIFYNNTSQVNSMATPICSANAIAYGSNGPTTAMDELPTIEQWTNVSLYSEPRTISNGSVTLSTDYVYTGKAARFATLDEIKAATNSSINGTANELSSYTFLLENGKSYDSACRSNYWIETPVSASNVYRIDVSANQLGNVAIASGNSGVRPVIEVPYSSIDGIVNIVEFDIIPSAMRTYFDNISTWDAGQSDSSHSSFDTNMTNNLNTNKCVYFENDNRDTEVNYSSGFNVYCDQPNQYDTGVTGNVKVYEYNESTGVVSNTQASYVTNNNGKLYNFIPGKVYYWESATDSSKHGYVRPTGERRIISIDNTAPSSTKYKTRNVRDLGGIKVDTNGDGTIDGTIKYGKLFRGEKIWGGDGTTVQYFTKLGISNEMDLRADSEVVTSTEDSLHKITSNPASSSNKVFEIIHYGIDYSNDYANYKLSRDAATRVMYEFVKAHNNGNDNYSLYFHCRIGADRTGTLAYILEGLLGAPVEERYRDYELTVFFGLRERTRYYYAKGSNTVKFQYLKKAIRDAGDGTTEDVMTWFLKDGNTAEVKDEDTLQTVTVNLPDLISSFRSIMIE